MNNNYKNGIAFNMFKPSDRWSDYMTSKKNLNAVQVKELLVDNMETNNTNPHASHLRRGANAIQGLESNFKRRRNRIPRTPIGLEKLNKEDSPSEEDTEGSDSESPAFDPTSPPYSVEDPGSRHDTGIHTCSRTGTRCGFNILIKKRNRFII